MANVGTGQLTTTYLSPGVWMEWDATSGARNTTSYRSPVTSGVNSSIPTGGAVQNFKNHNVFIPAVISGHGDPIGNQFECIQAGEQYYMLGSKEIVQGGPAVPCLRMDNYGAFRFRISVYSGSHLLSMNVKQDPQQNPRPYIYIKGNPDIGLAAASGSAPPSSGWCTIGPISFTNSGYGSTWVELHNSLVAQDGVVPCYWDHLVLT